MYLAIDYDYSELVGVIYPENHKLYNKIKEHHQEDNFCLLIEEKLGTPTPEKLNYFMQTHSEWIKQQLNID